MLQALGFSVILQFICLVHMVRTGRPYWWTWIIVLGSYLGVAVYALTQILPDLQNDPRARRAAGDLVKRVDPTRDLRKLRDELARADTVKNRLSLGAEFLALGEANEAEGIFRGCLKGLHATDPDILLALAQAQFAQGKAGQTLQTLEDLIAANPDFRSPDGHLLYARSLQAQGRASEALTEYQALEESFPGEEARIRLAELLIAEGRSAEARGLLEKSQERLRVAPAYYRKAQRNWSERAKAMLKELSG